MFNYILKNEVKLFKKCNEKDVFGQPTKVVDDVVIGEEEVKSNQVWRKENPKKIMKKEGFEIERS